MRAPRWGALFAAAALACAGGGGPRATGLAGPATIDLPAPSPTVRPDRVVLVSIASLTPDRYLPPDASMPVLSALAEHGIAADSMQPVFPPAAYPAHATLVTGVAPAKHRVEAELHVGPQGVDPARRYEAADLKATPLWQAVAQQGGRVAALDWPATLGASIPDLAPDVEVPAGGSWADALAAHGAGRAADLARRAGGADPAAASPGAARDASLVTMACGLLVSAPPPTFLLLRLSQTRVALDAAGPDAASTRAAFAAADADLGRLVRCLSDAGLLATTGLAVAGDHGSAPVHTEIRPNVALGEAGLIVPAGGSVRRWDAIARSSGGSAFVYAGSDDSALLARRALEEAANETGAFRVLSAKDMVERGADPEAWFGLEAEPGYVFSDAASGALLAPAARASAGGFAARDPRMAAGFVAWGPGLRPGLRVAGLRETDVAPTIARWVGAPLDGVEGRPMIGWFTPLGTPGSPAIIGLPQPPRN